MNLHELAGKTCVPCREGAAPLAGETLARFAAVLPEWTIADGKRLQRSWRLPDFKSALAFVNRIGAVAEAEDHHPDLTLGWGKVSAVLFTHKIGGLTESDFVLAAKIEALPR